MKHMQRSAALAVVAGVGLSAWGQTVPCGQVVAVGGSDPSPTPDFDQRRTDFPGGGGMYCVPTSFANLMAYYAQRGYPELFPNYTGSLYWTQYDTVSDNILEIAGLMGTTASGGTTRQPSFDGALAWMDQHGGPPMSFWQIYGDDVTPESMYRVLKMGGTAFIGYGRFREDSPGIWFRHGGHSVTLNSMERICPQPTQILNWRITYRDPATNEDPNNPDAQSPYATSSWLGRKSTLTFGSNAEPPDPPEVHTAFEFVVASDGTRRFFRELKALTPEIALHRPFAFGTVWQFDPSIVFVGGPGPMQFDPGPVEDAGFATQPGVAMVLRSQANGGLTPVRLAAWDAIDDALLAQVPLVGADALMCVGRLGEVHVFNNDQLRTFRFNGGDSPSFTELGTPRAIVLTAGSIVALGFDDRHDHVLLLRSDGGVTRISIDRTGAATGPLDTLGGAGVGFASGGRKRIAPGTSATGEDYWIGPMVPNAIGGPDTVRRFNRSLAAALLVQADVLAPPLPPAGGPGTWTHATDISDWSATDRGRMVLLRGTQLQEVKKSIVWGNVTASPWFGRTARGSAAVTRSRNGMDRGEPEPIENHLLSPDVDTDEVADCLADIGRAGGLLGPDGGLDNNDFIAFINLFFAGDAGADFGTAGGLFGHDNQLNNNDFISFINQFFAGCPHA